VLVRLLEINTRRKSRKGRTTFLFCEAWLIVALGEAVECGSASAGTLPKAV